LVLASADVTITPQCQRHVRLLAKRTNHFAEGTASSRISTSLREVLTSAPGYRALRTPHSLGWLQHESAPDAERQVPMPRKPAGKARPTSLSAADNFTKTFPSGSLKEITQACAHRRRPHTRREIVEKPSSVRLFSFRSSCASPDTNWERLPLPFGWIAHDVLFLLRPALNPARPSPVYSSFAFRPVCGDPALSLSRSFRDGSEPNPERAVFRQRFVLKIPPLLGAFVRSIFIMPACNPNVLPHSPSAPREESSF